MESKQSFSEKSKQSFSEKSEKSNSEINYDYIDQSLLTVENVENILLTISSELFNLSYVTYDYEPFCSDGFEINVLVSAVDMSYLNFLKYLYNEKINTIDYLNNCINIIFST